MSHKHSAKQVLLLLTAVLLISFSISHILQSTGKIKYAWALLLGSYMAGYMFRTGKGPLTVALTWLVYVKAAVLVVRRGVVEGWLVIRRDWDVCLWRAKQLP